MMLSQRMRRCRQAILDYQAANGGTSPSRSELAAAVGLHSKGSLNHLIDRMVERGLVKRLAHRARALRVLPQRVPVATYPDAQYFVVERVANQALLVPLERRGARR